jgi:serine O-acetyltransferase
MQPSEAPPAEMAQRPLECILTWEETRYLIRSDFRRLAEWYGGGPLSRRVLWFFQPNFQAIFLYRLYRYLYLKGWRGLARIIFLYSLFITGAEISPTTSIGPGCLIAHSLGVILFGKIGAGFSAYGQCGTGGGIEARDVGGGPGYPVVGDDVIFGIKAMALGPIRIGNRTTLGPAAFVNRDMPDGSIALSRPSKIVRMQQPSSDTLPVDSTDTG